MFIHDKMTRETWYLLILVVSLVSERSLFWYVCKSLPSFRYPIYLVVLIVHMLRVAKKTGFAYLGKELFTYNLIFISLFSFLNGALALLAAGSMGEGWRSVLLMHVSTIISLMDTPRKSVWTTPSVLFLIAGCYAVVVSDKQVLPGAVYSLAWIFHGLADRQRRRALADEQLLVFLKRESTLTLLIGILLGPVVVMLNKYFPTSKHSPEPVIEYMSVMKEFPGCLVFQVPFLLADHCGPVSGVAVVGWWICHFVSASLLVKMAAMRHPLDVAMVHTAALLIATILLFTRMHAGDEIIAALTVIVGVLCAHAAAEVGRPEAEGHLLSETAETSYRS